MRSFFILFFCLSTFAILSAQENPGKILYPNQPKLAALVNFFATERPTDVRDQIKDLLDDKPDVSKEDDERIYSGQVEGIPVSITVTRKTGKPLSVSVGSDQLFGTMDSEEQRQIILQHRLWRAELQGSRLHTDPRGGKLVRLSIYPGEIAATRARIGGKSGWRLQGSFIPADNHYKRTSYAIGEIMMSDANFERICTQMEQTFEPFGTIDLSLVTGQCYKNCNVIINKNYPSYYYGNVLYNGGQRGGLPQGNAFWAVKKECSREFDVQSAYLTATGNFKEGRPVGWHYITLDTLYFEGRFEDGQLAEVRYYKIDLLPGIQGEFAGKVVAGQLQRKGAIITNGDTELHFEDFNATGQLTGSHTLVARDGAIHKVTLGSDGMPAWQTTVTNAAGTFEHKYTLDANGNKTDQKLFINGRWNLPIEGGPTKPAEVVVSGDFIADVVNERFAGSNLTVEFLNERITLKGDFLNSTSYNLIAVPTGVHQMIKKGDQSRQGTYKGGQLEDGDAIYNLGNPAKSKAPKFNFATFDQAHKLPAGQEELVIPIDYVGGVAFAHGQWGKYNVEYAFLDSNGKVLQEFTETIPSREIKSRYLAGLISTQAMQNVAALRVSRKWPGYSLDIMLYK
ncbi:MAG: hypothetical protein R2879_04665 [Saprospiraceae bacterium]